jgi:transposase
MPPTANDGVHLSFSGHEYAMDGGADGRRRRRSHSAEFKAKVIQACAQPGVSVAAVALAHGLNANLVRCWLNGRGVAQVSALDLKAAQPLEQSRAPAVEMFLPVQLDQRPAATDIRLELRRGSSVAIVTWPVHDGAACGAWLREWLG